MELSGNGVYSYKNEGEPQARKRLSKSRKNNVLFGESNLRSSPDWNPVQLQMFIKPHPGIGVLSWQNGETRIFGNCRPKKMAKFWNVPPGFPTVSDRNSSFFLFFS
jgi:hypothetical protein